MYKASKIYYVLSLTLKNSLKCRIYYANEMEFSEKHSNYEILFHSPCNQDIPCFRNLRRKLISDKQYF